jgi:amidase
MRYLGSIAVAALSLALATPAVAQATLSEQAAALAEGRTTSVALTRAYLDRIERLDRKGPRINAVLALNPDALAQAAALDAERAAGKIRGPLHGVPILLKDNIETLDPMPTTAGSLALKDNVTGRDATLVARLRAAGAVILGKTNLSEWANIRSSKSTSGWSAVGGLTRNPHVLDRNSCGSSSGSGAAMAAGFAAATIGTETDGSVTCPASINGIVGLKPTVGLVSRTYIVPISHSQDTAGPMTATVRDAALMLNVIAGSDPQDKATEEADARKPDYAAQLSPDGLKGLRIGLVSMQGVNARLITQARVRLEKAGAVIVPLPVDPRAFGDLGEAEFKVLLTELKADLGSYLSSLPSGKVPHKSLADVIAFNKANAATELAHFGQETFELAESAKGLEDPDYLKARAKSLQLAGKDGIDRILAEKKIDLVVGQTNGPAWRSTLGKGDAFSLPSLSTLPAVAGYPHLTVPMGRIRNLPVGLSFIGPKWSDALVLRAGHAFEQAGPSLKPAPRFLPTQAEPKPKGKRSKRRKARR